VPIISVKILLHILVKSRKKNNLPIEEKILFLYFMRFLEVSINGKIESFIFLYQERQNASAKKDDFLSDGFLKSLFLKLLDGLA